MSQVFGRGTISGMAGIGDFLTDNAVVVLPDAGGTVTLTGGTTGLVLNGSANTVTLAGTLVVANGGTGATSLTDGGILLGSGTGAVTVTAQPTNGQLLIGSTGVDPVLATLASADSSVTITNGAGTINLAVNAAASGAVISLTTDDLNVVVPTGAGNINLVGAHGLNTSGAVANTASVQINNAITLGDLSVVLAGSSALTVTSGDITISGAGVGAGGNLNLPTTASASIGVIEVNSANFIHSFGTQNTFIGVSAGNFTLSGARNSGLGAGTLNALTSGEHNVAAGDSALILTTTGSGNVAMGLDAAGRLTTGSRNTAVGRQALAPDAPDFMTGNENTAIGASSLLGFTSGSGNLALSSGGNNIVGNRSGVLAQLDSGSFNIAIGGSLLSDGTGTGYLYTSSESSNILIGHATQGTVGESNTMRLGTTGAGSGQVNRAFIAGIYGITPAGATQMAIIDSNGQLGSTAQPVAFTWAVTTIDASIVINNGYIANKAGLLTMTLPATASVGDTIAITNINTAVGWRIAQNANQKINVGSSSTTVGIAGYVEATALGDTVTLVCIVGGASTFWQATSLVGNLTIN